MFRSLVAAVALALPAVPVGAQSVNIDFAGATPPDQAYRAAGAAGIWNLYQDGFDIGDVLDLGGKPLPVTLTLDPPGQPITTTANAAVTDPGDDRLLNDYVASAGFASDDLDVTFTGLTDGPYDVIVYAWYPLTQFGTDHDSLVGAWSDGGGVFGSTSVGDVWPGAPLQLVTHLVRRVEVVNGVLHINVHGPCLNCSGAKINGIQLVRDPIAGDFDHDRSVGFADLSRLLNAWGGCPQGFAPTPCIEDLTDDFAVGFADLNILLTNWGPGT